MKKFLIALQFLTVIPVKIPGELTGKEIGESTLFFPLVGALIGVVLWITALSQAFLPPIIVAALIIITGAAVTGGLHLDGFMDTCDGLYGTQKTKEQRLTIMRDSHVGAMGVLGVVLLLMLKFALLASFSPKMLYSLVLTMPVFARWIQVVDCFLFTYAREEGKGKEFLSHTTWKESLLSGLFTLSFFVVIWKTETLILLPLSLLLPAFFIFIVKQKLGGMTGDLIGASSEIAEVSWLLAGLAVSAAQGILWQ